jgi:hypothetical protein
MANKYFNKQVAESRKPLNTAAMFMLNLIQMLIY